VTTRSEDLELPEGIEILSHGWPADNVARKLLPGDLSQFAANRGPQKTDLSEFHPFCFDSKINAGGGLIYFDEFAGLDDLKAALAIMGVHTQMRDYAMFAALSDDPQRDDFLDQLRFVSHHALESGYLIWKKLDEQPLSLWEMVEAFIAGQRRKWNSGGSAFPHTLSGTRGGDGDGAKEALGFGFMVEDTEWRIYRIWSRSWLVLK
jgi:hypothetical protein